MAIYFTKESTLFLAPFIILSWIEMSTYSQRTAQSQQIRSREALLMAELVLQRVLTIEYQDPTIAILDTSTLIES